MPIRRTASTGSSSLADEVLDARGLKCPLPVLKLEKRLEALRAGARLLVLPTHPIAKVDIPLYCTQHAHRCESISNDDGLSFTIVKSGSAS